MSEFGTKKQEFTLEELRLDDVLIPDVILPETTKSASENKMEWFIQGPLDGPWIGAAAKLVGAHTLHVALAILYAKAFVSKNKPVVLERFHFDRFGVQKDSTRRALERLQNAGLIKYTKDGQKFNVTIIPVTSKSN